MEKIYIPAKPSFYGEWKMQGVPLLYTHNEKWVTPGFTAWSRVSENPAQIDWTSANVQKYG